MRKFRTKKIGKKEDELMKKLRKNRLSYEKIAQQMNISQTTVLYHLNKKFREKFKSNQRKYWKNNGKVRRKYMKEYQNNRYHNDPDYKKYMQEQNLKNQKKNREYWKKNNLCLRCGKKREDEKFKQCLNCRVKSRK